MNEFELEYSKMFELELEYSKMFELEYSTYILESGIIYKIFGDKKVTEEQKKEALDWFDFKGRDIVGDNVYKRVSVIFSSNSNLLEYLEKNLDSKRGKERPWVFFKDDFKKFSEVINNFIFK